MEKTFNEQTILEKLETRAQIRRKIGRTKDGKPDRIADTCEEAAQIIRQMGDLLAIIHRDGGQHTAAHGYSKSIQDATTEYYRMRGILNDIEG